MIYPFKGSYSFSNDTVTNWNSTAIGVYYCGTKNAAGELVVYYIGKSVADGGIRGRLLQHLNEKKWPDVTHFGYMECSSVLETNTHEATEIAKYRPKYNIQGK